MRQVLVVAIVVVAGSTIAVAAMPRSGTVTVGDSSLKPTSVTIVVGGSVTWLDSGNRSHRITSDTRAFSAFSLSPASRHSVIFKRTGRYRYHVDGGRKGLVVVVAGTTGGEAWAGTFESHGTNDGTDRGGQICTATWKGALAFTVAGGRLSGKGEASLSGAPSCTLTLGKLSQLDHVTFVVEGTETSGTAGTTLRLLMHVRTLQPSGPIYDAGGFMAHVGNRNEGVPFELPVRGRTIDVEVKKTLGEVTLDDHFVLTRK